MRRIAAVFAACCLVCSPLVSQVEESVATGSRVRIKTAAAPDEWLIGAVGRSDATSIWVGERAVSRASIRTIEVSQGMRSRAGKGAVRGGLGGLAVGAIAGLARGEVYDDPVTPPVLAVAGGVVGAVLGGLIGAASSAESWRRVDRNGLTVALLPGVQGGAGVRLGMSF